MLTPSTMNTSQKLLVSLLLLAWISMTGLVTANYGGIGVHVDIHDNDDSNTGHDNDSNDDHDEDNGMHADLHAQLQSNRDHIKTNWDAAIKARANGQGSIHANKASFHSEFGFVGSFFATGLSTGQKAAIEARIEKFQSDREALFDAMIADKKADGQIDSSGYVAAFTKLRADYYADLRVYVDPAKRDDYDAFVAARTAVVVKNMAIREETRAGNKDLIKENKEFKDENKGIRKALSLDKMKEKFSSFTDVALNNMLVKVNTAIDVSTNATLKDLLAEIKAYIEVLIAL